MDVKARAFPIVVKRGSANVKIYKTPCRGVDCFTLSYWVDGVRKRQAFDNLEAAKTEAAASAARLTAGDLDVLTLTSADRAAYLRARQLLDPLGIAIEVGAAQHADAVKRLRGVSVARAVEFYLRHHDGISAAREVPEIAEELLAAKRADKLSPRYLKQLAYDLKRVATQFPGRIGAARSSRAAAESHRSCCGPVATQGHASLPKPCAASWAPKSDAAGAQLESRLPLRCRSVAETGVAGDCGQPIPSSHPPHSAPDVYSRSCG